MVTDVIMRPRMISSQGRLLRPQPLTVGVEVGTVDTLTVRQTGQYPSYPYATLADSGTRLVAYRDATAIRTFTDGGVTAGSAVVTTASASTADLYQGVYGSGAPGLPRVVSVVEGVSLTLDEVPPETISDATITLGANHSAGGGMWLRRNEADPVELASPADAGEQIQDTFVVQDPSDASRLVALVRTYPTFTHQYMISVDDGLTWSSLAALPAIAVWSGSTIFAFFDFVPSQDGKVLATCYGYEAGQSAAWSLALLESTNGVDWTLKSWIARYDDGGVLVNESGLIRLGSGRLLCIMRNSASGGNVQTQYSDNDGATWSARSEQPTPIQAPRGRVVNGAATVFARYNGSADGDDRWPYACAWWTFSNAGVLLDGPNSWHDYRDPIQGGYQTLVQEPSGLKVYAYASNLSGVLPALIAADVT